MDIAKIEVLPSNELAIYPSKADGFYQHIYREAAGVHWNNEKNYFYATLEGYDAHRYSCSDWFKQITLVVSSGLGMNLTITSATQWVNVPADQKNTILNL